MVRLLIARISRTEGIVVKAQTFAQVCCSFDGDMISMSTTGSCSDRSSVGGRQPMRHGGRVYQLGPAVAQLPEPVLGARPVQEFLDGQATHPGRLAQRDHG
ncbi:MAG: hypothetical protein K2X74_05200 [Acetobacteraceae bacterium]|nr:hypothetical protein [Acetobacteraceae bacterium]